MDDLDEHLLEKLRLNARAPVAELARALGLSRTTIQSRLARLEKTGVISGYAVRLARSGEGAVTRAHLMLNVDSRRGASVVEALGRLGAVVRVQTLSGPFDIAAEAEAESPEALGRLVEAVAAMPGVERVSPLVVLATRIER